MLGVRSIDRDGTGPDTAGRLEGPVDVVGPDGGGRPAIGVVGDVECFLVGVRRRHRDDRADELDFVIFSGQKRDRLGDSHAKNVRAHRPDGHYTDGLARHMADGNGGFIQPTGKMYAIDMVTVGIWTCRGVMDEEFVMYDQLTFMRRLGPA